MPVVLNPSKNHSVVDLRKSESFAYAAGFNMAIENERFISANGGIKVY